MNIIDFSNPVLNEIRIINGVRYKFENNRWRVIEPAVVVGKNSIVIPAEIGIPYPTAEILDDRVVWAVRIDPGNLPHDASKTVTIPSVVTGIWDRSTAYVDVSQSYANNPTANITWPFTANTAGTANLYYLNVVLRNIDMIIRTQGTLNGTGANWSTFNNNVIVLKFRLQGS